MQQRQPELNRWTGTFAIQVAAVLAVTVLVEEPRMRAGLPRTLPFAVAGEAWVQVVWMAAAAGAGFLVALIGVAVARWRRLSGRFGAAAGAVLAVVLVVVVRSWLGHAAPTWLSGDRAPLLPLLLAPCAAALGLLAAPLFRERDTFSILWVSAVLALPLVLARNRAVAETVLEEPLRALQAAAPWQGEVFLGLPDEVPSPWAWALCRSLAQRDRDRLVLAVPAGSPEQDWLLRMGVAGVRLGADGFEPVAPTPPGSRLSAGPFRLQVAVSGEGGPRGELDLSVRVAPAPGPLLVSVLTAGGVVRFSTDESGRGRPAGAELERLRALVQPMPAGTPLRLLVVSPGSPESYGWQDVKLP